MRLYNTVIQSYFVYCSIKFGHLCPSSLNRFMVFLNLLEFKDLLENLIKYMELIPLNNAIVYTLLKMGKFQEVRGPSEINP